MAVFAQYRAVFGLAHSNHWGPPQECYFHVQIRFCYTRYVLSVTTKGHEGLNRLPCIVMYCTIHCKTNPIEIQLK